MSTKKRVSLFLVAVILFAGIGGSLAFAQNPISVVVDGRPLAMDVPPQIINDRTLVPMRAIFEALGSKIVWNPEMRRIKASTPSGMELVLTIDSKKAILGGFLLELDVPPQIIDGRTMVPVRVIAEAMGAQISWSGSSRLVTIVSGAGGIGGPNGNGNIKGVPVGPPPGPIERARETARKLQELGHKVEFVSEYPVAFIADASLPVQKAFKEILTAEAITRRLLGTPKFEFVVLGLPNKNKVIADALFLFLENRLMTEAERKNDGPHIMSAVTDGILYDSEAIRENIGSSTGFLGVIVHEYVHLVHGNLPPFLWREGIATYVESLVEREVDPASTVRHDEWKKAKLAPSSPPWDYEGKGSYGVAFLATEFLMSSNLFDHRDLVRFLLDIRPGEYEWKKAFEGTFGIPFDAFWYIYSKKALPRMLEDESYRPNFDEYVKAWYVRPLK